ncbi:serine/threonine-protein kinase [Streptomyces sp. NPDC096012]|uniref:serine/threonine-protein kinase n=1 Tax=Streptomyces sp. NPDC096012 TaxID=3155684 RepID=UPI00336A5FFB
MQPLEADEPAGIGPYRLLGRLGSGGMGRVYLGRSAGGRTVAVKIVHPHFARDEEFRARFRREVAAARRVGGAWTAPVLDADPDAPVPWVATAYAAGPSLAAAVTGGGPLPAHTVRALGAGLAEALTAVHELGLVHRDVKPSNVLLTLDGPLLIDFGIARAMAATASLTSTGVSIGSPGYMSPEQVLGRGVSGAADVFSLGAVLACAALGEPPFRGDSSAALLYKVVHEEPELGSLDGEMRELVAACLAKDPAARPAPAELARRLAPEGTARLIAGGWLPGPLVEQVSRSAVHLLNLDTSEPPHSGPVDFSGLSIAVGERGADGRGEPGPGAAEAAGPGAAEAAGADLAGPAGPDSSGRSGPDSARGSGPDSAGSAGSAGRVAPAWAGVFGPAPVMPTGAPVTAPSGTAADTASGVAGADPGSAAGRASGSGSATGGPSGSGAGRASGSAAGIGPGAAAETASGVARADSGSPAGVPSGSAAGTGPGADAAAASGASAGVPVPWDVPPPGRVSLSVAAASGPVEGDRGRRLSCTVAVAVAGALAVATLGLGMLMRPWFQAGGDDTQAGSGSAYSSTPTSGGTARSSDPTSGGAAQSPAPTASDGSPGGKDDQPGAVPARYLGTWEGQATGLGGALPMGTFRLTVRQARVGQEMGRLRQTDQIGAVCDDTLLLKKVTGTRILATSVGAPGNHAGCNPSPHQVELTPVGHDLRYTSDSSDEGKPVSRMSRVH